MQYVFGSPKSLSVNQDGPFTYMQELSCFAHKAASESRSTLRLLDLRCGTGAVGRYFASNGWEVVGIDPSSEFVSKWALHHLQTNLCTFQVGDVPSEVFFGLDTWFDMVVGFDDLAVEFLDPQILGSALELAASVLRPKGHFVFQVERASGCCVSGPIRMSLDSGFSTAWRASVVDLDQPLSGSIDHDGSRELFVAKLG